MSISDDSGAGLRPEAHGANTWLNGLFNAVERAPGLVSWFAPVLAYGAWCWTKSMRTSTLANARHLRPDASPSEQERWRVV